jgi:hypothetical protein
MSCINRPQALMVVVIRALIANPAASSWAELILVPVDKRIIDCACNRPAFCWAVFATSEGMLVFSIVTGF